MKNNITKTVSHFKLSPWWVMRGQGLGAKWSQVHSWTRTQLLSRSQLGLDQGFRGSRVHSWTEIMKSHFPMRTVSVQVNQAVVIGLKSWCFWPWVIGDPGGVVVPSGSKVAAGGPFRVPGHWSGVPGADGQSSDGSVGCSGPCPSTGPPRSPWPRMALPVRAAPLLPWSS